MNCQTFEEIAGDLARGQLMDAAAREVALQHVSRCARCAARLENERALSAGLRALAAEAREVAAPPRVEAALLAAFRAQKGTVTQPAVTTPAVRRRWAWAAAAAVLLLVALAGLFLRGNPPAPPQKAEQTPARGPEPPAPPAPPRDVGKDVKGPEILGQAKPAPKERAGVRRVAQARPRPPVPTPVGNSEVVTRFMPLVYGDNTTLLEGGQIVRVSLPRSAVLSLGFPVNMDRVPEAVKADVVLGHDGLARAIRFVR